MGFRSILREIVEGSRGGLGAALLGSDGVAIEQVVAGQAPRGLVAEQVGAAGVEFGRILDDVRKASDAVAGGAVLETVVVLTRFTLLFRSVSEDAYLVVLLAPDGNLGKARYLIRRNLIALRREL